MKLLIDTCVFLWIASDSTKLSRTASTIFMDSSCDRFLSVASAWEIGIKYAAGRLPLPERPDLFVPRVRAASGISPLEIDEDSSLLAGKLEALHSDPFDRMLIAQAIVHGLTIITPDPEIAKYPVRTLW